jgi:osmotically inducible protein OsmC
MSPTVEPPSADVASIADRRASVVWKGSLREGAGLMSTESGVLDKTQYSFRTRFLNHEIGTNPTN